MNRRSILQAGLAGCGALGAAARGAEMPLRAGAAAVRITPSLARPVYIAGYDSNRIADRVQDDVWARALVLDDGMTRLAVVACDLIGLSNYRVRRCRARVKSVPAENVLIACTHVHSGPDTLGLWGPSAFTSGLDPLYMARLEDRIGAVVDVAAAHLEPVGVSVGSVDVPEGFVHNSREPIQDRELTAYRFEGEAGKTVASLVHYGGHPEVNKSRAITSDFVHTVREMAEAEHGGTCLFLNGALGGMVTPKVARHDLPEMLRVGRGVGEAALSALGRARPLESSRLRLKTAAVRLPLDNPRFQLAAGAKLLDVGTDFGKEFDTEVWRLDLGETTWVTIPGEVLPKPSLELKGLMPGKHRLVVALGNDELGYILDPADFDRQLYSYEKSMSVGKQTWPLLLGAARKLLAS